MLGLVALGSYELLMDTNEHEFDDSGGIGVNSCPFVVKTLSNECGRATHATTPIRLPVPPMRRPSSGRREFLFELSSVRSRE